MGHIKNICHGVTPGCCVCGRGTDTGGLIIEFMCRGKHKHLEDGPEMDECVLVRGWPGRVGGARLATADQSGNVRQL